MICNLESVSKSFKLFDFNYFKSKVRESAFGSIKVLLLRKYLSATQIEEQVCPTSFSLLNLEGIPEDIVKERHPDAFVVGSYSLFRFHLFFFRLWCTINLSLEKK